MVQLRMELGTQSGPEPYPAGQRSCLKLKTKDTFDAADLPVDGPLPIVGRSTVQSGPPDSG